MLSLVILLILLALLFAVSVFLCSGFGFQNIPDMGLFDYLNLLFFNAGKFGQYGINWNITSTMHFFLFLFFGVFYCSASARNYRAGMDQMELIRYGKYGRYFFSCNLKNALNALKYIVMTGLLPLSILFVDKNAFSKFGSILNASATENVLNITVFLIKIFALLTLLELIFLALIRKRDYSFSLAVMTAAAAFAVFADSLLKTGFVTLGNIKNQLIAAGIYTMMSAALYAILRREPKSI